MSAAPNTTATMIMSSLRHQVIHVPHLPFDMAWPCHVPVLRRGAWRLRYRFRFDERAMYWHGGEDQYDWNKGGGLGAWRRMDNMCMVAWRYVGSAFEVGPYWHPAGASWARRHGGVSRLMPEDATLICRLAPGDEVVVELSAIPHEPYRMHFYMDSEPSSVVLCEGTRCPVVSREVSAWFGGTSMPPRVVKYYRSRQTERI